MGWRTCTIGASSSEPPCATAALKFVSADTKHASPSLRSSDALPVSSSVAAAGAAAPVQQRPERVLARLHTPQPTVPEAR